MTYRPFHHQIFEEGHLYYTIIFHRFHKTWDSIKVSRVCAAHAQSYDRVGRLRASIVLQKGPWGYNSVIFVSYGMKQ
jgi:hypothetical protein